MARRWLIVLWSALLGHVSLAMATPTPPSAEAVRAVVNEMLADARSRSSLVGSADIEYRGGMRIIDSGGTSLRVRADLQFRYLRNSGSDDDEGGFQIRRQRLSILAERRLDEDRSLSMFVQSDVSRSSGRIFLLDAYGEFDLAPGWSLRVGQFVVRWDRELLTSATSLLTIERSEVSSVFRVGRSQGVMLAGEGERVRGFLTFSDGRRQVNCDFDAVTSADAAFTGRAEFRWGEGGWGRWRTQSSAPGEGFGVLLGLGGHWQHGGLTDGAPNSDLLLYTADLGFEGDGWNTLLLFSGRSIAGDENLNDYGVMAQGGLFVTERVELYGRYAHLLPDAREGGADDDLGALTFGANWYPLGGRGLRLSAEVTWFTSAASDSSGLIFSPDSSINLLPDEDGEQVGVTLQAQILF